ncbi:AAA family ATPase [Halobacterium hubeiense]|uniref:AAA family ATPase n=1 Tax=Halobacterium hubeiense TaxID=1407499 RepID=UPI003C71FA36
MELEQLSLKNFRQFRDDEIEFASGEQNVTVIHGSNGSGKTTLLNAFTWVLYDTVDFDTRPERLATEGVMAAASAGDEIEVSVSLEFTHEGEQYTATRRAIFEKQSEGDFDGRVEDSEITLERTSGGRNERVENADHFLNTIIPKRLSELFFFDGEDIDELAGVDNQGKIQESIENIMGLTILERATRHLDHVAGVFEDEFADFGSDELRDLVDEKKDLQTKCNRLEEKRDDKQREQKELAQEITDIEARLERFDDSRAMQEERAALVEERNEFEKEAEEATDRIRSEIGDRGYAPLVMPLMRETAEELDKLRQDGVIPSNLTDDFLNDLLENQQCICGRDLSPNSESYEQVSALKGDAPAEGVESAALRIIGQLRQFSENRSAFVNTVEEQVERRSKKEQEAARIQRKIDDISDKLGEIEEETPGGKTIKEWEAERQQKEAEKEEAVREEERIKQKIETTTDRIDDLENEISDLREDRGEAVTARRRQRAAELVRDEIGTKYDGLKQQVREVSNEEVQETFRTVARKDLNAEISADFELKIYQDVSDGRVEVEKSTGERQIASLAFIGSLVNIAGRRYESNSENEYFTGGIYPLVMDSPFGALDKEHRREISRVLPTLASQVVVFATNSQWEGPVEEEMTSAVGSQYWLNFHPGDGANDSPRTTIEREQAATTQ